MGEPGDNTPAEPPVDLDSEFELWTVPGFEAFQFVHHRLFPGDSLPLGAGEEHRWNAQLEARRERLRRHEEAGEFAAAVRMHHHDYWAEALLEYRDRLEPGAYWRLVGELYSVYLTPRALNDEWMQIFSASPTGRDQLMTDDELEALSRLPDLIEVLRGFAHDSADRGFSWTRSRAVAEYFARQAASFPDSGPPRITQGVVSKDDVVGVLLRRGEDEIIALPDDVAVATVEELAA